MKLLDKVCGKRLSRIALDMNNGSVLVKTRIEGAIAETSTVPACDVEVTQRKQEERLTKRLLLKGLAAC